MPVKSGGGRPKDHSMAAKHCQQTGIEVCRDNGNFLPQGTAARAEVSTILERFIEEMI